MIHFLKKIFRNNFFRSFTVLVSGTVLAQLIPLLLQPVLKRLFSPEVFGLFDIYLKSIGVLVVIFTLRLEYALVLPRKREEVMDILVTIFMIITSIFVLSELIIIFFIEDICSLISFPPQYHYFIFLLPLSALFYSFSLVISYVFVRDKKFFQISKQKLIRRSSEGVINIFSGLGGHTIGLFVGDLFGNIFGFIYSIRPIKKEFWTRFRQYSSIKFVSIISKYKSIIYFNFTAELLNVFALSSITFTVLSKFDIVDVGYLELTQRVIFIPAALVGVAVGKIILESVTSARHSRTSCKNKLIPAFAALFAIASMFFVIIWLWGEPIFTFVFGDEWLYSGKYAKIIVPATSFMFVISPFGQVLIGLGKLKANSLLQIIKFLFYLYIFFMPFSNIVEYLLVFTKATIFIYLTYLFVISFSLFQYERSLKR